MDQQNKALEKARHKRKLFGARSKDWLRLCDTYLPESDSTSIWRHSAAQSGSPAQGWKLHISATILNAVKVLKLVGPLLLKSGVPFKGIASLDELEKLNTGIYYGYSQVGKFLTIYPPEESVALNLARALHRLTQGFAAPTIPFDRRYRKDSCVYYRYGSFIEQSIELDGKLRHAIQDASGNFVEDKRNSSMLPAWVSDPFITNPSGTTPPELKTPLTDRFKAFGALSQRGKGGVFKAFDFAADPPRHCVLKEGRRHGELRIDGRDGYWRVQQEAHVLKSLASKGVLVPSVYADFKAKDNYYVAIEFLEGTTLEEYLKHRQRRLTLVAVLRWSIALAKLLTNIHEAGWVWRDCKPRNLIVLKDRTIRAIDFEGASEIANPDPFSWATYPYAPPESTFPFHGQSQLPEDLYSLGKVVFFLITGRLPEIDAQRVETLRRGVPPLVCDTVASLLHENPARRPTAKIVMKRFRRVLADL